MAKRASQTDDKFIVRLPDGMRDMIKEAAEANNRTMTAEIVARLRASFGQMEKSGTSVADLEATVRLLMSQLDRLQYDFRMLEAKVSHL